MPTTTHSRSAARVSGVDNRPADEQLRRIEPLLHTIPQDANRRLRTIAVMPAYNAEATIERTLNDIPLGHVDEVILVDDCSSDRTVEVARTLGITVIERRENGGYGANQKTCYRHALERGADYVVMLHPDFQYDSRVAGLAVDFLKLGICDVVLGSRIRTRREALEGGMPVWKYIANRCLTTVENIALGQNLGDFHSGFRAYSRKVLETIPFHENSDDFVFDSQFLAQAVHFGFRIGDVPVPVRYFEEASSIPFRRCITYGCGTLRVLAEFYAHRWGWTQSPLFQKSTIKSGRPETGAPTSRHQTSPGLSASIAGGAVRRWLQSEEAGLRPR
ncbi:MAG: glycosyltransferase family 2 protein [Planctomycetaceae bacterium]